MEGVRHVEFDDVLHGLFYGPWYGNAEVIGRWWPAALEEWHTALDARVDAGLARDTRLKRDAKAA
jgi:hypothetical protein